MSISRDTFNNDANQQQFTSELDTFRDLLVAAHGRIYSDTVYRQASVATMSGLYNDNAELSALLNAANAKIVALESDAVALHASIRQKEGRNATLSKVNSGHRQAIEKHLQIVREKDNLIDNQAETIATLQAKLREANKKRTKRNNNLSSKRIKIEDPEVTSRSYVQNSNLLFANNASMPSLEAGSSSQLSIRQNRG